MNIYEQDLGKNAANHVSLSPVSFVERSAEVFGDLESVVHGRRLYCWQETRDRFLDDVIRDRAHLGIGRAAAQQEEVRGARDPAQIQHDEVGRLALHGELGGPSDLGRQLEDGGGAHTPLSRPPRPSPRSEPSHRRAAAPAPGTRPPP